ncbi:hypothetical protein [Cohnella thermotolerans]|uniref:hypothetical protein n=1 Tax=Cohnella thermotolerans TaxID=329858 RepID=UPI00041CF2AD|nr:hypothetical protein [Cohnella thermotolerans]
MLQKSPGGSVFPYYYKGGEVHCLKYGSFFKDTDALFNIMKSEESFIIGKNRKLNVWVDFYETSLTNEVLMEFVKSLHRLDNYIGKLSIVGFSAIDRWRFRNTIKKLQIDMYTPIKFYSDPEDAKTWLVQD